MASVDLSVEVNVEEVEKLDEVGQRAVQRAIELVATEVWGNVAREAPVDEGRLAGSFKLDPDGRNSYRISTDVDYASYVNDGTRPHEIVPRNRAALFWKGADHPVKRVQHPGTKANPFVDRAIDSAGSRAAEFAKRAVREVTS